MSPSIPPAPAPREYEQRIARLGALVAKHHLDALISLDTHNRLYLTGLRSSEGMLVVRPGTRPKLCVDFRYHEMARRQAMGVEVALLDNAADLLGRMAKRGRWRRVGFEGIISANRLKTLRQAIPNAPEWVECGELIQSLRLRKSPFEQAAMRRAVRLGDRVLAGTVGEMKPGMTEWDVRRVLRGWADRLDAYGESFDCAVAAGANASKPHAQVSQRVLRRGEPVLIDMGVKLDDYCSDITRMVFLGSPSARMKRIYSIVLSAQLKAIDAVRAGRLAREVDAVARGYIARKGFGKCFGHGLGHGIGLEVHEPPALNARSETVLQPGMVITIEPGIYIPGVGGVRIEDVVVVRRDGCEILTGATKDIVVVD